MFLIISEIYLSLFRTHVKVVNLISVLSNEFRPTIQTIHQRFHNIDILLFWEKQHAAIAQ